MQTKKALIKGKVQGVGFRASTKRVADKLGVKGYAKNLADGRVEVVMQASEKKIQKMLSFLEKGPVIARVEGVEVMDAKEQDHKAFRTM